MTLPLSGLLVVSLEQAVAAPMCTCRLADAGARVIKIERPEGDFARGYDDVAHGESSYFVWLNRGKESVVLDLDQARRQGAARSDAREGRRVRAEPQARRGRRSSASPIERLRREHPRLIVCSVSGYGEAGPTPQRKAYDLLIQAEAGRRLGHRRARGAGARRRLGLRHRRRHERLRGDPGSADRARPHRRGRGDLGVDVRRHGRLDDGAAAAARGRQAAQARRPRAHLDRALRRVQDAATAPTS